MSPEPAVSNLRRFGLRVRRGLVWYPRRCVDCGGWHLNGRYVSLPMCVYCFGEWLAQHG